jgi:hypothetical protein
MLTDLVELEEGNVPEQVRDAARLALAGPMPDFAEQLRPYVGGCKRHCKRPPRRTAPDGNLPVEGRRSNAALRSTWMCTSRFPKV